MKLDEIVKDIEESEYPKPLNYRIALRFRGVGKESVKKLIEMGLVKSIGQGLSIRALNILSDLNITNQAEAKSRIIEGSLVPWLTKQADGEWHGIRNYGWKTHKEVCAWAGVDCPVKPARKIQVCPHCGKPITAIQSPPAPRSPAPA